MSGNESTLSCELRERVGSRDARRLRYEGRAVGNVQATADQPALNLHFDAAEFATARRKHVHLFDLMIGGEAHSVVVNNLQWDAFGDKLMNVEFRRVQRGVAIDSLVEIEFVGTANGVVQHTLSEVMVRCVPSAIPDSVLCKVEGLPVGTHVRARDLVLPEGVALAVPEDTEVAMISALRAEPVAAEPTEGETPA